MGAIWSKIAVDGEKAWISQGDICCYSYEMKLGGWAQDLGWETVEQDDRQKF